MVFDNFTTTSSSSNMGKIMSGINSMDVILAGENRDIKMNLNMIPTIMSSRNLTGIILKNYEADMEYDVFVVYRLNHSSVRCQRMKTRLDTSFIPCFSFKTQKLPLTANVTMQYIKPDQICDGHIDCDNGYDESDKKCQANNFFYTVMAGAVIAAYVVLGFPIYFYLKHKISLTTNINSTAKNHSNISLAKTLICAFLNVGINPLSNSLRTLFMTKIKVNITCCQKDEKTRHLLQLIYVLSLHLPYLEICYDIIDQWLANEELVHSNRGDAMACLLFCQGEHSYISGFIRDTYERHDLFSRLKKGLLDFCQSLICFGRKMVFYLAVIFNLMVCILRIALFYYDIVKDLLTLKAHLHLAENIFVKTNQRIRFSSIGGINMEILFYYAIVVFLLNLISIHSFVYNRRCNFSKIFRRNARDKKVSV